MFALKRPPWFFLYSFPHSKVYVNDYLWGGAKKIILISNFLLYFILALIRCIIFMPKNYVN